MPKTIREIFVKKLNEVFGSCHELYCLFGVQFTIPDRCCAFSRLDAYPLDCFTFR